MSENFFFFFFFGLRPSSSMIARVLVFSSCLLTRFKLSTTSASTIDFTFPFELLFVLLLLPCIIKLVCLINFRALGESRNRRERGTVGCCVEDGSIFDKFASGHILWISLIPSLTVDRLCILSSVGSNDGTAKASKAKRQTFLISSTPTPK